MENASKALIMAGEILIALIVLGLAVGIVVTMGRFSANMNDRIATDTVAEFNEKFIKYEGRIDISAEEIVTAINFAKHSNDEKGLLIDDLGTAKQSVYWVDVYVNAYINGHIREFNIFKDVIGREDYKNNNVFKSKINTFLKQYNETYFYCNVATDKDSRPEIIEVPSGAKKGIININLTSDDIAYSLNTKDKTKLVTSIRFGVTDDGNGNSIIKYKNSMSENERKQYAFTVRNHGNNLYTYRYNK